MRILLDHCMDRRFRRFLPSHQVRTTREMRWDSLENGDLLDQAQGVFDVLLTVDQNMQYQQTIAGRSIALVVLVSPDTRLAALALLVPELDRVLPTVVPGNVYEVRLPPPAAPPLPPVP
jgi:predicted nuclease of predicted toxin-antitoxin system